MTESPYIIAFGKSAFVGLFPPAPDCGGPFEREESVVVRTERGLEMGRVVGRSSGPASHERLVVRRFDAADEAAAAEMRDREESLFGPVGAWLNSALPGKPLIDVELMFDRETALLHGFWNEDELRDELAEDFRHRFSLRPLFYDAKTELVVEAAEPAERSGCGREGCGSSGGGCSSCGDGKSGCSTGSCSRGTFKKPEELKGYLLSLRETMEAAASRVALH